jgi:predicted AAA+ superfamily ATPase
MTDLGKLVEMLRSNLPKSLDFLERARMLGLLRKVEKSPDDLSKPEKIFLDNPNLAFALGEDNTNTGNLRETFFYNQLRVVSKISAANRGDFTVDEKYVFEVGGKGKDFSQIAGIPNSFVAADNIENGFSNKIPLWLFGFLY